MQKKTKTMQDVDTFNEYRCKLKVSCVHDPVVESRSMVCLQPQSASALFLTASISFSTILMAKLTKPWCPCREESSQNDVSVLQYEDDGVGAGC